MFKLCTVCPHSISCAYSRILRVYSRVQYTPTCFLTSCGFVLTHHWVGSPLRYFLARENINILIKCRLRSITFVINRLLYQRCLHRKIYSSSTFSFFSSFDLHSELLSFGEKFAGSTSFLNHDFAKDTKK